MKILIKINTDSELVGYEAMALAFFSASFGHSVQLYLTGASDELLKDDSTRVFGMIQSLALYDIPLAWTDFLLEQFEPKIAVHLTAPNLDSMGEFDSVLEF